MISTDNLMTGSYSIKESKKIVKQGSLEKVGLNLRKWISNHKEIIENVENAGDNKTLSIEENESVKALGLQWKPFKDEFKFCCKFTISKKIN